MSDPWAPPPNEPPPDSGSSPPPAYPPPAYGGRPPPQAPHAGGEYSGQLYREPYGQGGYQQPAPAGYGAPFAQRETDQTAVIALVCSVLAWIVCPIVLAIVALVLAGNADKSIAASGGAKTGEGLAKAARIISWINIAFYGLGVALVLVLIFAAALAAA